MKKQANKENIQVGNSYKFTINNRKHLYEVISINEDGFLVDGIIVDENFLYLHKKTNISHYFFNENLIIEKIEYSLIKDKIIKFETILTKLYSTINSNKIKNESKIGLSFYYFNYGNSIIKIISMDDNFVTYEEINFNSESISKPIIKKIDSKYFITNFLFYLENDFYSEIKEDINKFI
jgi:hypothetical protein